MKKIGVFGSAFNPPTRSHQTVLEWALNLCDVVYVVPSYRHAFGKSMLSYPERIRLLQAFLQDLKYPRLMLWDLEPELAQAHIGPVYTFDVLSGIEQRLIASGEREFSLSFIVGPDNSQNFQAFHRSDDIVARWELLHAPDAGEIRSTRIRSAIAEGLSFSDMTTPAVASLIQREQFYVC